MAAQRKKMSVAPLERKPGAPHEAEIPTVHIALRATEDQRDALKGIALAKKMTMQALLSGFIDKLIDRETNRTKS